MTKSDIIDSMAAAAGIKKTEAAAALAALQSSVQTALREDGKLQLHGFGTFKRTFAKAKQVTNPQDRDGPKIPVAAKWRVGFKPASDFSKGLGRVVAPKG